MRPDRILDVVTGNAYRTDALLVDPDWQRVMARRTAEEGRRRLIRAANATRTRRRS